MKNRLYSIFIIISLFFIYSCTPLMNDLELSDLDSKLNKSNLDSVNIIGISKIDGILLAQALDSDGNNVEGKLSFQWQYFDTTENEWKNIDSATTQTFICIQDYENKKVKVVVTQGDIIKSSEEITILQKATPDPVNNPLATVNIIGAAQIDGILFAQALDSDGNQVGGTLAYQWQYYDETSKEWKNIDSATTQTFLCIQNYENKKVKVVVKQGDITKSSEEKTIASKTAPTPENKPLASVNLIGTPKVDEILFAQALDSDGNQVGGTLAYQWQYFDATEKEWKNIDSATTSTFTCIQDYENKKVKVVVTQGDITKSSEEKTIASKTAPTPENKTLASVNLIGTPKVDEILFAQALDSDGNQVGGTLAYQWQYYDETSKEWKNIEGSTTSTFTCIQDYENKKVKVVVKQGDITKSSEEKTIASKTAPTPENKPLASVNLIGTPKVDEILFAQALDSDGNQVGGTLAYQWQYFDTTENEWKNIDSATTQTFICIQDYENKKVKVVVTQGDITKSSEEKTIASKTAPTPENKTLASVNLIGSAKINGTLFAEVLDSENNPVGGQLKFEWQYFDEITNEWKNISGADKQNFECTEEYAGMKIKVVVTQDSIVKESLPVTIAEKVIPVYAKIETVNILGNPRVEGTLFAEVLDSENKPIGGQLVYQWKYYDESASEWKDITGAVTASFDCPEEYENKKVKVVVKQDSITKESAEKTILPKIIPQNDKDINAVIISSTIKYDEILYATLIDDKGNLVDGKISYKWEYLDESDNKWKEISGINTPTFRITDKTLIGKKLRITAIKDNKSVISNEATVQKAILVPSVFEIDIPIVTEGESIAKDSIKITLKDKYGNDVKIKDIDYPKYTIDESFPAEITIKTDEYEELKKQEYIRVKWRDVEDDEVPEFADGYESMPNGKLKFKELTNYQYYYHMEYSYDGGTTWTQSLDEFTPTSRYILLRWKGDNYNETTGRYSIYPSTPYELAYKSAQFKVVNFTLDQADISLTFDEATGTLTMEEGFGDYIWFVKSAWHPYQDVMMINPNPMLGEPYGIDPEHPNKFNLANFFEELPEDMLKDVREDPFDPWPEYGRPGKYYIQGVALASPILESVLGGLPNIPYSATCWVELK